MKTKQQIRKELTEIKYYHTHRDVFESHSSEAFLLFYQRIYRHLVHLRQQIGSIEANHAVTVIVGFEGGQSKCQ